MTEIINEKGWVRLYRKSLESSVWYSPMVWMVWSWCLMKANHLPHKFPFNGQDIDIKEGQFITGIHKAIKEIPTNTPQKHRTALNYLKSTNRITIKTTNKFSIITIINWEKYQCNEKLTNKITDNLTNEQQSTNKPITTYKNDKNDKKELVEPSSTEWILEDKLKEMEKTPNSYLDVIATFIREKPVKVENSKQLSNVITRYCRVAKSLSGAYTNKQIFEAAEKVKKDNEYRKRRGQPEVDFTLETFYKQLTK